MSDVRIAISPELSILIDASVGSVHPVDILSQGTSLDWGLLTKLAQWHQVRPLLFDYLDNKHVDFPQKQRQYLKEATVSQVVTNMTFLRISIDLYQQLSEEKIHTFLMKGAVWAWMLYEKPGSREFGDIDYFIEKSSVKESLRILAKNGFEPDAYRSYLLGKDQVAGLYLETDYQLPLQPVHDQALRSLEIQWNSSYPRYCYNFTWEELAAGMIDFRVLGTTLKIPRLENQLLMMLVHHGGIEQWDKLKYLSDFVRILRKSAHLVDWNYIISVTRRKGFYRIMMEGLGLVRYVTGEDYLRYCHDDPDDRYPSKGLLESVLNHWENERPVRKTKSWRMFKYNLKYRDRPKDKMDLILAHLYYLTRWKLIWHKFVWYSKNRF